MFNSKLILVVLLLFILGCSNPAQISEEEILAHDPDFAKALGMRKEITQQIDVLENERYALAEEYKTRLNLIKIKINSLDDRLEPVRVQLRQDIRITRNSIKDIKSRLTKVEKTMKEMEKLPDWSQEAARLKEEEAKLTAKKALLEQELTYFRAKLQLLQ